MFEAGAPRAGWNGPGMRWAALGLVALLVGAGGALYARARHASERVQAPATARPARRAVWVAAVEFKGEADAGKEPFPAEEPPPGQGVRLMAPRRGRWETEVYRWDPGVIVAYQGDELDLNFWGVNGSEHPAEIEGYGQRFTVRRGRLTRVRLVADRVGIFRIVCHTHTPSMVSYLVVLPRTAASVPEP